MGRSLGVVFAVPFCYYLAKGQINNSLKKQLGALFLLGGTQGALGKIFLEMFCLSCFSRLVHGF